MCGWKHHKFSDEKYATFFNFIFGCVLRTGSLRGRRSLRDGYTGFALGLPLVGKRFLIATNGSADRRVYKSRSDRPARSGHFKV
ncbi:hypothetical protein HDF14_000771 [Edaphobacter lichenicola]|uniref:Uncharacterized protein n=1 Tax=Tunturiibacter gelidiferens TaxID=3069689 RepID=A0A9X0QB81_9BACT|nr:hypothetical protein [Edaphobacter lichenicola]